MFDDPVRIEVPKYQLLRQRLLSEYPNIDEETLADTLEGITDLHEMIAAVIRSALVDEALHAGLRLRLDDMRERLSRLELRASKKRQLALEAMTEVDLSKLEQPDFTASARNANGTNLHYVEGWHVITEANRIFGYDAWDRRTLASHCVWNGPSGAYHGAAYTAKVRVSVRAGDITIVREGSGTGEGKAPTPGQAHELALKGAETDATKRALATFGNPFGLALYDREQLGVRKAKEEKASPPIGPWVLRSATGAEEASFDKPSEFAGALRNAMTEANDIELLFAIWEQNVDTVRALNRSLKQEALPKSGIAPQLVSHLKRCAIALVKPDSRANGFDREHVATPPVKAARPKIDKSVLTFGEPKRIRCKEHLRFVASQPCLICGRSPSHAHHVRFAQSKGLSLKVSDEFTVPLCATHHHYVHTTGKEREWWQERNIDPLIVANRLWQQSRERFPDARAVHLAEDLPARVDRGTLEPLSNSGSDSAPTTPNPTDSGKREA